MKQFLFITDLDYTLVGDDDAMAKLNQQLELHRQQHGTKIVYSTGRSPFLYQKLAAEKTLLAPDILVCSVGTEIYINGSQDPDARWSDKLSQAWDRNLVKTISANFTELKPQPESEQRDFKVSYFLDEKIAGKIVPELERALLEQGLDIQVIYSGGQDVDILPRHANKGMAMTFVRQHLEIDVAKTVACGDSGNDIALFANRKEKGIIVGNAKQELLDWHKANPNQNRYLATAKFASGIAEGLQHFGFLE
ncbi:sucrose-phosphate phosphatase [Nostoc sp. FACHB-280]|uniref:sucrose-phosphate phosphatase n=1 Tax=Nostoc sp. FACHB-280 TaxID=2692839 RepID=UPI00168B05C6|nr:sucrose-phosphate phosphatase [Nostoc sp. FACHB-280]MBD2496055.1 sucrose-phosphate phosphatase [Nostoc sp. FACHB-280]